MSGNALCARQPPSCGAAPVLVASEAASEPLQHLVRQVPMFATCGDGFIKALVQLLRPQVLLRGDCAFKAYEAASTMYFIQNGCVQIVNHAQNVVHITLFSGAYFGELAMLGGPPSVRQASIVATRFLHRSHKFL